MKILNANLFNGKHFILTPFKRAENCLSIGRGLTSIKIIKHDHLKVSQKLQIWERIKMKILKTNFLRETLYSENCFSIHLSNVLTDHFSNSLSEKTTNDVPMKFYSVISRRLFIGRRYQTVEFTEKSFL